MSGIIQTDKTARLGFGYMRLPKKDGAFDIKQICKMADAFIENGGTYFDAAYVYEGAEVALRESVVKRHPRDNVLIATKLNMNPVNSAEQLDEQFKTSLERLGTDYVDFYLLHGLNAGTSAKAEKLGAWDYQQSLKEKGLIMHAGFSFHGLPEELDEILTKHPEAEFVQLQINYFDWENQKVQSRLLYETARKHDKPIVVMEPVKGGMLASGTSPIADILRNAAPNSSMASWALRFVAQLEGIFVILSGMSSLEQLTDNIATFKALTPLTKEEQAALDNAINVINGVPHIACTSCRYCINGCPSQIAIPAIIDIYNDYLIHKPMTNLDNKYKVWTKGDGKAGDCVACRACESVCPQKLEIVDTLAKVSALFD